MNPILKRLENFLNLFSPPRPISWQTLISLGFFSWAFAMFSYSLPNGSAMFAARFSNNFGFIFFIIGFFWFQTEKPWKFLGINLRPILVGLFIAIFLFKDLSNSLILILQFWPIFSGMLSITPEFFQSFKPIIPPAEKRTNIVTRLLIYLLITCWVNFYFLLQVWLVPDAKYSYFDKNLNQSVFVVRLIPREIETLIQDVIEFNLKEESEKILERGKSFTRTFEIFIKNYLEKQPWDDVENLIENIESNKFQDQLNNLLENQINDNSWSIKVEVVPQKQDNESKVKQYNLNLWLIWKENSPDVVKIKKTCELKQSTISIANPNTEMFAELSCQNAKRVTESKTPEK